MVERKFGWKKDRRDERDYLYRVVKPRVLPDKVDLSQYCPPIADQGNEGSCVGHGVGGAVTAPVRQQTSDAILAQWRSKRWIYNGARALENRLNEEGAEPRDACDYMKDYGILDEADLPYVASDPKQIDLDPRTLPDLVKKAKDRHGRPPA